MSNPSRNILSNISITGDVSNSAVVLGNDNNVTINVEYRPFVDKFLGRMADLTEYFVGREFLDSELEKFLENNECGYFTLIGEPGIGKSAWAAHVIQTQKAIYHFCEHGHEITNTLSNLAVQISQLFNIPAEFPPSSAPAFAQYFSKVIYEASLQLEGKLVIVIDSLDQLDVSAINTGANVLLLPESLPKGVFIVTTTRPPAPHLIVKPEVAKTQYIISSSDQANQTDAMQFIREKLASEPYAQHIQSQSVSLDEFAKALLEQSAGNFMYLRTQFIALEDPARFAAGIEGLPLGLHKYYEQFWHALEHEIHDEKVWEETKSIFGLLAVAYDSVDADWIGAVSKQDAKQVSKIFDKHIAEFLTRENKEENYFWKIYHQSFRDFLAEKVRDLTPYHRQIADYYRVIDFSTASVKEVAYGIRNFVKHLDVLGEKDEIYKLVTGNEKEPVWVNAHYALNGEYSGYLRDLNKAWTISENEKTWDLGRQLHCAIILSSIQSLMSNIPQQLIMYAAKYKLWSAEAVIRFINSLPTTAQRTARILELEPHLEVNNKVIWELISGWVRDSKNEDDQSATFKIIFPLVNEEGKRFIIESMNDFEDPSKRIRDIVYIFEQIPEMDVPRATMILRQALSDVVEQNNKEPEEIINSFLDAIPVIPELRESALFWKDQAEAIDDEIKRMKLLSRFLTLYDGVERHNLVSALLEKTLGTKNLFLKEEILKNIIPFLSDQEVVTVIEIINGFRNDKSRQNLLKLLVEHSPEMLKKVALDELMHTQPLKDKLRLLVEIFEFIPSDLFSTVLKQFQAATSNPKDLLAILPEFAEKAPQAQRIKIFDWVKELQAENIRAELLAQIAVLIGQEILPQVLEEIRQVKDTGSYFRSIGWLVCFMPVEFENQIFLEVQSKYEKQGVNTISIGSKKITNLGIESLYDKKIIWYLIELSAEATSVKLALLWRSPERIVWNTYFGKREEKRVYAYTFNRFLDEERNVFNEILSHLSNNDRMILLQMMISSTQHIDAAFSLLDPTLYNYNKFKSKVHIVTRDLSLIGTILNRFGARDLTLANLIGEGASDELVDKLRNAKGIWGLIKIFSKPFLARPDLHKPEFLYKALIAVSLKSGNRYEYKTLAAIWEKMKFTGVKQNKKTWSEVIRTSASRDLKEFLFDLLFLAPLLIEVGGQKAIQETYEALRDIKTWWAQSD